jgi:hypothetical protein
MRVLSEFVTQPNTMDLRMRFRTDRAMQYHNYKVTLFSFPILLLILNHYSERATERATVRALSTERATVAIQYQHRY